MNERDSRTEPAETTYADARPARELEARIGHVFRDPALLEEALTHSSYRNECRDRKTDCNERLEFLGDSILSVVTAEYLFETFPREAEGFLTRTRAALVCENTLAVLAAELELGDFMYFGHGEAQAGVGRQRKSILADAFEALLAAVYLDSGSDMDAARAFLLPRLKKMLPVVSKHGTEDFKTRLQRIVQQTPEEKLHYEALGEEGPPHDRTFHFAVYLNSNLLGEGTGKSKREAEQEAARRALILLGELDDEDETAD